MSGVYIKGMEMPKACVFCELYESNAFWCSASRKEIDCDNYESVASFCPLIPVPEHGRLIDADALGIAEHEERFVKRAERGDWMDEYIVGIVDGLHEAGRRIINAPTIIEADKGVDE